MRRAAWAGMAAALALAPGLASAADATAANRAAITRFAELF